MTPGERCRANAGIWGALERERRQLQAGRPAFRALVQGGQVAWVELHFGPVVQEDGRLLLGETQVGGVQFAQLVACSQPGEREARIRAGREDKLQGRRKVLDEEGERQVTLALDHVIVVQHQDRRTGQSGELVEQQRQHGVKQAHARSPQRRQRMPPDGRIDPVERLHDVGQQAQRIVVALVEVHPAGRAARSQRRTTTPPRSSCRSRPARSPG